MATSLTLPPAFVSAAPAKPSADEVKKKLTKLNEQVDQAVQQYNKTQGALKAAKKKLAAAKKAADDQQKSYEGQRKQIAQMAATAYKNGDTDSVTGFVSAGNPQVVLDQAAVIAQLSRNRTGALAQFLAAAQRVAREKAQAQQTLDDVTGKLNQLKSQKADLDKQVKEQRKLLAKLGGQDPTDNNKGGGGTYNGPASGNARTAINYAYSKLGSPYVYGADGPNSFDCSGLTEKSWAAAGVDIGRDTYAQWGNLKHVSRSDLQPGDLVFFNSLGHVGLYIGNGKMIHAPHTGTVVQIADISSGYYQSNFYGAARP
ncbi:C40 family peptidase [Actinomadura rupiterrae]|uniref:C40 family peptidase n=1 Tax=Actinomadura rupiterrae TaxID=559627 RepID=UPI0020A3448B|nr:C40 family peptidase [Actinomadura rupiterrae]MCP2338502.1 cell wall-associated NlpC family hydrolase [Actinomadura rupiterrae]